MMELLEFYVSGFWVWLGITIGLSIVAGAAGTTLTYLAALIRR